MRMNAPRISVIIPVYKVERYLQKCLDSIVNQTYENLEIIIIDDGSPDRCGSICDEYAAKDKRIVVIHKENGGLCAARNEGINRATGDWIAFVDSDDWCEIDYYERMLIAMGSQNVDIFCSGGCMYEYDTRTVISRGTMNPVFPLLNEERPIKCDQMIVNILAHHSENSKNKFPHTYAAPWDKLYSASLIKNHGLQFDTMCNAWEDVWFNLLAFYEAKKVGVCDVIGYHYRMVFTSITKGFNPEKPRLNYRFIENVYRYMQQKEIGSDFCNAIDARCFMVIRNAFSCCYFHPSNTMPYVQKAREIREMKQLCYYRDAIYRKGRNPYLTPDLLITKYLLRCTWIWPIKLGYSIKQKIKRLRELF